MIDILEKDGAVIITVENPTVKEKNLIYQAKRLMGVSLTADDVTEIFSKFKNVKKSSQPVPNTELKPSDDLKDLDLEGFVEICGDDIPF